MNLNDPRTRRKCLGALNLAYEIQCAPNGQRFITAKNLYPLIGAPNIPIGIRLRRVLNRGVPYKVGSHSSSYVVNVPELRELEGQLQVPNGLVEKAHSIGRSFLTGPGALTEQPRTGNRYYPWWVTMKKTHRQELFIREHKTLFDWDIRAAKATLMLQAYDRVMLNLRPELYRVPSVKLPTWRTLVGDRTGFRNELARQCGCSVEDAKWITQIVLNGGYANIGNPTWRGRFGSVQHIQGSELYQLLRKDFRTFWGQVRTLIEVRGSPGETLTEAYNALEFQVIEVIAEELTQEAWFVHDGFMTKEQVDVKALEEAVRRRLNFEITLEGKTFTEGDLI